MKQVKLNINTKSQKYSIIIGKGVSYKLPRLLFENSITFNRCLIVIDNKIKNKIISKIKNSFKKKK